MKDFSGKDIVSVASIIAKHLKQQDIEVVVVGGLAVNIYTFNRYQTNDIDMINTSRDSGEVLARAMAELGFYKQGRHFHNQTTRYFVEFPPAPLNVADETNIIPTTVDTAIGTITILDVYDVIRDRLTWVFSSQSDRQSLVQAICLMVNHDRNPSEFFEFMRSQSPSESSFKKQLHLCSQAYQRAIDENANDMITIEEIVEDEFINSL